MTFGLLLNLFMFHLLVLQYIRLLLHVPFNKILMNKSTVMFFLVKYFLM